MGMTVPQANRWAATADGHWWRGHNLISRQRTWIGSRPAVVVYDMARWGTSSYPLDSFPIVILIILDSVVQNILRSCSSLLRAFLSVGYIVLVPCMHSTCPAGGGGDKPRE
ncbi:hypothetical protein AFLA_005119 [Aspergillus flavus NRRL3357]|nr:hypothetical protein AFLA_005119 [Aspergillus flavus NRRL3357]